jgi:hypothetical protein
MCLLFPQNIRVLTWFSHSTENKAILCWAQQWQNYLASVGSTPLNSFCWAQNLLGDAKVK